MVKPDARIAFAGRPEGLERDVFTEHGFPYYPMRTGQVKGRGLKAIKSIFLMGLGVLDGMRAIKDFDPDIVLGVGGYVSVPACFAAVLTKRPFLLHEQNTIPGGANRLMGRFAEKIFLGFEGAAEFFPPDRTIYVGNPLRYALVHKAISSRKNDGDVKTILIIGGSQGARVLNDFAVELVKEIREKSLPFRVIHQTGQRDYERMAEMYAGLEDVVTFFAFDEEMGDWYQKAHFAVSRAGAIALAELLTFGIPAVLVPYPFAADGHQEANAREMEKKGCYMMVRQEDLSVAGVLDFFDRLSDKWEVYRECRVKARKNSRPFAADEIARSCIEFVVERGRGVSEKH